MWFLGGLTLHQHSAHSCWTLQVKYDRSGPTTFSKAFSYESRPSAPWSYPQTGEGSWIEPRWG